MGKFVEFEALKPDKIIKFVTNNEETVAGTISKNLENSGLKTGSILNNLAVFILVIILAIVAIMMIVIARLILKNESHKKKIRKLIKKQKEAFMWNNSIGAVSVSYLKNCIAVSA